MLSVGGVSGPALLGTGLFGNLELRRLLRLQVHRGTYHLRDGRARWITVAAFVVAALVWFVALQPLLHDLVREGGILREEPKPRVLR